jgi:ADP-ribosylation factor-like protein 2
MLWIADFPRGLDAAGKTTICKKLLDEPIDGVSPTLGFIIKTIDYDGFVRGKTL